MYFLFKNLNPFFDETGYFHVKPCVPSSVSFQNLGGTEMVSCGLSSKLFDCFKFIAVSPL
jgi:hypothetical protein